MTARRREFTRKQKAEMWVRCGGYCEGTGCGAKLKTGEAEYDHVLPEELADQERGPLTVNDGQVLCRICHRSKTADDIRSIRKADRQRDKHAGAMKRKTRGIPGWRRFDGSPVYADRRK